MLRETCTRAQVPTFVSFNGEDTVERFSGADPSRLETMVQELEKR